MLYCFVFDVSNFTVHDKLDLLSILGLISKFLGSSTSSSFASYFRRLAIISEIFSFKTAVWKSSVDVFPNHGQRSFNVKSYLRTVSLSPVISP